MKIKRVPRWTPFVQDKYKFNLVLQDKYPKFYSEDIDVNGFEVINVFPVSRTVVFVLYGMLWESFREELILQFTGKGNDLAFIPKFDIGEARSNEEAIVKPFWCIHVKFIAEEWAEIVNEIHEEDEFIKGKVKIEEIDYVNNKTKGKKATKKTKVGDDWQLG